jgi:hypothetical protein
MHDMQLLHEFGDRFENRWHGDEREIVGGLIASKPVTNEEKCTSAFPDQQIY